MCNDTILNVVSLAFAFALVSGGVFLLTLSFIEIMRIRKGK
jgi:hypothetical protein